jgi:hypothetical protein
MAETSTLRRAASVTLAILGLLFAGVGGWAVLSSALRLGSSEDPQARATVTIAVLLGGMLLAVGLVFLAAAAGVARGHRWGRVVGLAVTLLAGIASTLAATSQPWLLVVALGCWATVALLVALSRREGAVRPTALPRPSGGEAADPPGSLGRWRVARSTRVLPADAIVRLEVDGRTLSVRSSGFSWALDRDRARATAAAGQLRLTTPYEDLVLEPLDRQDPAVVAAGLSAG